MTLQRSSFLDRALLDSFGRPEEDLAAKEGWHFTSIEGNIAASQDEMVQKYKSPSKSSSKTTDSSLTTTSTVQDASDTSTRKTGLQRRTQTRRCKKVSRVFARPRTAAIHDCELGRTESEEETSTVHLEGRLHDDEVDEAPLEVESCAVNEAAMNAPQHGLTTLRRDAKSAGLDVNSVDAFRLCQVRWGQRRGRNDIAIPRSVESCGGRANGSECWSVLTRSGPEGNEVDVGAMPIGSTAVTAPATNAFLPNVIRAADGGFTSGTVLGSGTGMAETEGLVVAVAVEEGGDPEIIVSAIEYDPDFSEFSLFNKRRFCMFTSLALLTVVVVAMGASVATMLARTGSDAPPPTPAPTTKRENLGIGVVIERVFGSERLADHKSPYARALDWILFDDPQELSPADENLFQRYITAYLYFATTVEGPWESCNPPKSARTESPVCSYQNFNMPRPLPASAWLSSANECDWNGIDCDGRGTIRSLNLGGVSMSGTFPEGIVYLPLLQNIDFYMNNLTGTLPSSVFKMKFLTTLRVDSNQLSGRLPDNAWQSRTLHYLDVGNNMLTGTISSDIANLTEMKTLYLHENLFNGVIPHEIGLMENVINLRLHSNQFIGTIPSTIANLKTVQEISLSRNYLTGSVPDNIGSLSDLEYLELAGNALTGALPESLWDLTSLRELDLSGCRFTGSLSPNVVKLSETLSSLKLSDNLLEGLLPANIGQLNLVALWINGNHFTGTVPQSICDTRVGNKEIEIVLEELQADCAPKASGGVEIRCPDGCCTVCCLPDGTSCMSMESGL